MGFKIPWRDPELYNLKSEEISCRLVAPVSPAVIDGAISSSATNERVDHY